VDRSVDLSQERFHGSFATDLELRVHCGSLFAAPPLLVLAVVVSKIHSSAGLLSVLIRAALGFVLGSLFFHSLFVIFGVPVLEAAHKTFVLSMHLAVLAAVPLACTFGTDLGGWRRVVACNNPKTDGEVLAYLPSALAVVGTWFGAIPIPLDWDRPWQAWPITCTAGAIAGHALGCCAAFLLLILGSRTRKQKRT